MILFEEDDCGVERVGLRYFDLTDAWYASKLSRQSFTTWLGSLPSVEVRSKFWGGETPISGYWTSIHARDAARAYRMVRKHFARESGIDPDDDLPPPPA